MAFRFVHTADLHLDSPLKSLALRDPALAERIGVATREAFAAIVRLCLDERVDALVIAGDVFDGARRSVKTALFFHDALRRLGEAGVRVFLIWGNHDMGARDRHALRPPSGVVVFGGRAETVRLDAEGVAIHGLSFPNRAAPESLLPRYPPPEPDLVNIGLMHTSLGGAEGHDVYAPTTPAALAAHGYEYWALGHIHKRQVLRRDGPDGRTAVIVMAGAPQGRHINESGPKHASLVTIHDDRRIEVEARPTALAVFERIALDIAPLSRWDALAEAVETALAAAAEAANGAHLIARLRLVGRGPLARRLRRDQDALFEEANLAAARLGAVSVEGVATDVRAVEEDAGGGGAPLTALEALLAEICADPAFEAAATEIATQLERRLPTAARDLFGDAPDARRAAALALAEEGARDLLSRLAADEDALLDADAER